MENVDYKALIRSLNLSQKEFSQKLVDEVIFKVCKLKGLN